MITQIPLVGGPLNGTCHEIQFGWPIPDRLGLPDSNGKLVWYEVHSEQAFYLYTNRIKEILETYKKCLRDTTSELGRNAIKGVVFTKILKAIADMEITDSYRVAKEVLDIC